MSITLDGITFCWDGETLLVTTAAGQHRLTGGSATKLLDFLLSIQQDLYAAEQARELPTWAHSPRQFVNGGMIEVQPLRLAGGTIITQEEDQRER